MEIYNWDIENLVWEEDPLVNSGPRLQSPFGFYSEYIRLSSLEQAQIAEDYLMQYYKCLIKDLHTSNSQLKSEVGFLKTEIEDTDELKR